MTQIGHEWTGFADFFAHVRTGDVPKNVSVMLADMLGDATNLGPKRMASASKGISAHQIGWMRTFHARSETYRAAQACITDAHTRHPHSRLLGRWQNLVVSAIVHWNTVYIERAVTHLGKARREIPDHLLKRISPLSWEHIYLTCIYTWDAEHQMPNGFRSLRLPAGLRRVA